MLLYATSVWKRLRRRGCEATAPLEPVTRVHSIDTCDIDGTNTSRGEPSLRCNVVGKSCNFHCHLNSALPVWNLFVRSQSGNSNTRRQQFHYFVLPSLGIKDDWGSLIPLCDLRRHYNEWRSAASLRSLAERCTKRVPPQCTQQRAIRA